MAIDYVNKIASVVSILKANNTCTSSNDLSASLSSRIVDVYNDDPNIRGGRIDRFPSVFVSINNAIEEETQIGNFTNRKKEKVISYDVHGFFNRKGYSRTHEDLLTDFYQMASNVEAVLKANADLSGTALHSEVVDTDFKLEQPDNTLIKIFKINYQVRYIFS